MTQLNVVSACVNCEHWVRPLVGSHFPDGWGSCSKMSADCCRPLEPPTMAFAFESGVDTSQVATAPCFSCAMFKAKQVSNGH